MCQQPLAQAQEGQSAPKLPGWIVGESVKGSGVERYSVINCCTSGLSSSGRSGSAGSSFHQASRRGCKCEHIRISPILKFSYLKCNTRVSHCSIVSNLDLHSWLSYNVEAKLIN